jgi:IS30 family transposase
VVDRASRYLRLVHLPVDRSAEAVPDAMLTTLRELPDAVRLTLTWDQGSELAYHDQLAPMLRDGVFFAHPGSPWQRGTNENTNGLLRQYLPKRTDLSIHTAQDLRAIEERLNNRPRKILNWCTPAEIFTAALAS